MVQVKLSVAFILVAAAIAPVVARPVPSGSTGGSDWATTIGGTGSSNNPVAAGTTPHSNPRSESLVVGAPPRNPNPNAPFVGGPPPAQPAALSSASGFDATAPTQGREIPTPQKGGLSKLLASSRQNPTSSTSESKPGQNVQSPGHVDPSKPTNQDPQHPESAGGGGGISPILKRQPIVRGGSKDGVVKTNAPIDPTTGLPRGSGKATNPTPIEHPTSVSGSGKATNPISIKPPQGKSVASAPGPPASGSGSRQVTGKQPKPQPVPHAPGLEGPAASTSSTGPLLPGPHHEGSPAHTNCLGCCPGESCVTM